MSENTTHNGVPLVQGRIYLRDKRNGRILQYEELLANMAFIEKFEYTGKLPDPVDPAWKTKITLSGLEKAAEFDRLASMKPEQRVEELAKREAYVEEQQALTHKVEEAKKEDPYSDSAIALVDNTGPTLAAYREKGWTNEQLIGAGLAKAK